MEEVLDISARTSAVADRLSNFTPRRFWFKKVLCESIEGLLQALKTSDMDEQMRICGLVGREAKSAGKRHNETWKKTQTLWFMGKAFKRQSPAYQQLLDEVFEAACQDQTFVTDLLATGNATLVHTMGKSDPTQTVLTEKEFCSRLMKLRAKLQKQRQTVKEAVKNG